MPAAPPLPSTDLAALVDAIEAELRVAFGSAARVTEAAERLAAAVPCPLGAAEVEHLRRLGAALERCRPDLATSIAGLLVSLAATAPDPWSLVEPLLHARRAPVVQQALALARALVDERAVVLDERHARDLASCSDEMLPAVTALVGRGLAARLFLGSSDLSVRALAARVLDLDGTPAPSATGREALGAETFELLQPYLEYTRATHGDLLALAPVRGAPAPGLGSLRRAEAECGSRLFRAVLAELGWAAVCHGLEVRRLAGVRVDGSLPLWVRPEEADLLARCAGALRIGERRVIVAHGGASEAPSGGGADAAVARYRASNLAHARVLQEILDVAPLDRERALRLVDVMDGIVADHVALFAAQAEECAILPEVWSGLRAAIASGLEREAGRVTLSPELSRLVLAFEDPPSIGRVGTLHGLKRFLHQRALRLGFHLVRASGSTNRTIDLLLASGDRLLRRFRAIEYVDFEPDPARPVHDAVQLLVDAFAHHLLHDVEGVPAVRLFLYGNEVQVYASYGSHPALLRLDLSPPLHGGMIDVEFFGVSRNELDAHPARHLEALRLLFGALDFACTVEPSTRVHARYDKERARDLGSLLERAAATFRLLPLLMDLDWTIGDLRLPEESRTEVARAWAESFRRWGAIRLDWVLSQDRLAIVAARERGVTGEREVLWRGDGPYRDRASAVPGPAFWSDLGRELVQLGVEGCVLDDAARAFGQTAFEAAVLRPLREAVARGELEIVGGRLTRAPGYRFRREHEAEVLAGILAGDAAAIEAAARIARLVTPLEKLLSFRTTGSVNRHDVERAEVPLRGGRLRVHVLRDGRGMMRLGVASRGPSPSRRRAADGAAWEPDLMLDAAALAGLLRASGYVDAGSDLLGALAPVDVEELRERFGRTNPLAPPPPLPGEVVLAASSASPGRAVGRALLGSEGRGQADVTGAVLVCAVLRPDDGPLLRAAAGVVATGGGILSHAGLLASEASTPAVVLAGTWARARGGAPVLRVRSSASSEQVREVAGHRVALRIDPREQEVEIRDGDLLVVDADRGIVQVLGHEPDALALQDGIAALRAAGARLGSLGAEERAAIGARGDLLRARHRVAGILSRVTDPVLARFGVGEVLLGDAPGAGAIEPREKAALLGAALANPSLGGAVRRQLVDVARELGRRLRAAVDEAALRIPDADLHEVLARRVEVRRTRALRHEVEDALHRCGMEGADEQDPGTEHVETLALRRLEDLRAGLVERILTGDRHALRALDDLGADSPAVAGARAALAHADADALRGRAQRLVLGPAEAGHEVAALVGWKAANLAELSRLCGGERVPPWFAVTDRAFRLASQPLSGTIDAVLSREDLDRRAKAAAIRALWESLELPQEIAAAVAAAYTALGEPFVAVRSSAREEDTARGAGAGEFDTFLFVQGVPAVLAHLARAWAGLWGHRALEARAARGEPPTPSGGGLVVQRMVRSRVSGIVQTIHVAAGEPREIVVNAGLGLGEGIVGGTVEADLMIVAKDGDLEHGPLRVRSLIADKREQVVFDARRGGGTVRVPCVSHQRLRPALEYVELLELVREAVRLERALAQPVDVEFALEGERLWLLQVRPVPAHAALLREARR